MKDATDERRGDGCLARARHWPQSGCHQPHTISQPSCIIALRDLHYLHCTTSSGQDKSAGRFDIIHHQLSISNIKGKNIDYQARVVLFPRQPLASFLLLIAWLCPEDLAVRESQSTDKVDISGLAGPDRLYSTHDIGRG